MSFQIPDWAEQAQSIAAASNCQPDADFEMRLFSFEEKEFENVAAVLPRFLFFLQSNMMAVCKHLNH
jgi:hypothetical protein